TAPYWDVSFIDTSFGYMCTSSGIVLKTTDGGVSWITQIAGDTRSLYTIYAIDTLRASAGGFAGKVVYTSDGGNNWLYAGGGGISAPEINKIKFMDEVKGCLASSGGFYKSTNGGVSWYEIIDLNLGSSKALTTNLSFPTEEKGFVTGGKMLLAKTTNEGENWSRTIVNADLLNIFFSDEYKGIINSKDLIYTTNDGGYTLDTLLTFPYNQILYMDAMNFLDSSNGFIGVSRPKIYKTIDSGENWYLTNITGLTDTIGAIIKFFSQTQLISWAIKSKQIMKTTDRGENWFVQLNSPGAGYFSSIHFIDSLYGWASILNRRPFKTTDGGENWIEQTNLNFYQTDDVYFKDTLNGWLLDWNKLYKTIDGGINWTLDSLLTGFGSGRFGYFDSENIFITGDRVYRTTNAGINWTEFPELANQGWRMTIDLFAVNSGFLVGNTGLIFKYYDETVPVELINFEGWLNENETNLQWTTATETNNRGFYIQRKKLNEQEWIDLDFIEGKGNSTEINYYSYKDILTESGVYCYRLKQTDFDGTYNYSEEIEIYFSVPLEYELFQNFPNPANPIANISFTLPQKSFVEINLYSINGELVKQILNEEKEKGIYNLEVKLNDFASGVYFYKMTTDKGFYDVKKLVLLK
ncbi:MAG: T9SS C-terminal target domain-containing protein, partial [Ignavibacteriae bacterium]|nr:T9SS C-terminal target domain-containing protein [Ignavibacteriota bacterium]